MRILILRTSLCQRRCRAEASERSVVKLQLEAGTDKEKYAPIIISLSTKQA